MSIVGTEAQRQVTIYGLFDPRNEQLRYVGKTVQRPSARLSGHIYHRIANRTKCSSWIKSLQKQNRNPELGVLEVVAEKDWREAEIFWIASFKLMGANLCNLSEGGQGPNGARLSEEHKMKISATSKGRYFSAEARKKISEGKRGIPRPDLAIRNAQNAKLSNAHVEEIKRSKEKACLLALRFGVSKTLVSLIRSGQRRTCEPASQGDIS